jgi:hypothetical protein
MYSDGRLPQALAWLDAHTATVAIGSPSNFIAALFDVGDLLVDEESGLLGPGSDLTVYRAVGKLLNRDEWADRKGEILLQAIADACGVYFPTGVVSRESQMTEAERRSSKTLLDGDHLVRARELCARRLHELARKEGLPERRLGSYLYRWRQFAGDGPPKEYVADFIGSLEGALRILRGFTSPVGSQTPGSVFVRSQRVTHLEDLETLVGVERLREALRPVLEADPLPEYAPGYSDEIMAFKNALGGRSEGREG